MYDPHDLVAHKIIAHKTRHHEQKPAHHVGYGRHEAVLFWPKSSKKKIYKYFKNSIKEIREHTIKTLKINCIWVLTQNQSKRNPIFTTQNPFIIFFFCYLLLLLFYFQINFDVQI